MTTTNEGDAKLMADVAAVEKCPKCEGRGWWMTQDQSRYDCLGCNGTGRKSLPSDPAPLRFGANRRFWRRGRRRRLAALFGRREP